MQSRFLHCLPQTTSKLSSKYSKKIVLKFLFLRCLHKDNRNTYLLYTNKIWTHHLLSALLPTGIMRTRIRTIPGAHFVVCIREGTVEQQHRRSYINRAPLGINDANTTEINSRQAYGGNNANILTICQNSNIAPSLHYLRIVKGNLFI